MIYPGITTVTAPTTAAVTRSQAKKQCEVAESITDHDEDFDVWIEAATKYVENATGRQLMVATYDYTYDQFPCGNDPILLPHSPLSSVTSVKYTDTDGNEQTWASSNYIVVTSQEPGEIHLAYQINWPAIRYIAESVTVRAVVGYATQQAVPHLLRSAVLMICKHYWEDRGGAVGDIPAVDAIVNQYRVGDEFHAYAR